MDFLKDRVIRITPRSFGLPTSGKKWRKGKEMKKVNISKGTASFLLPSDAKLGAVRAKTVFGYVPDECGRDQENWDLEEIPLRGDGTPQIRFDGRMAGLPAYKVGEKVFAVFSTACGPRTSGHTQEVDPSIFVEGKSAFYYAGGMWDPRDFPEQQ